MSYSIRYILLVTEEHHNSHMTPHYITEQHSRAQQSMSYIIWHTFIISTSHRTDKHHNSHSIAHKHSTSHHTMPPLTTHIMHQTPHYNTHHIRHTLQHRTAHDPSRKPQAPSQCHTTLASYHHITSAHFTPHFLCYIHPLLTSDVVHTSH